MTDRRRAPRARLARAAAAASCALLAQPLLALLGACSASPASSAMTPGELRAYSLAGTAPLKSGLMSPGDDWKHLREVLGYWQTNTPQRPAVYLLGGSVARESQINDLSWRRQIVDLGGPKVEAFNLGSMNQSFDDNIAMVKLLPDVPTLVIIGVNLGRYTWHEVEPEVTAGRIKPATGGTISPYNGHRFTRAHIAGDVRKRARVQLWLDERYPVFKANFRYNAGRLDELVAACLERGFHPVIMNLPMNLPIIRHSLDAPRERYANNCRNVAEKYDVPYVDFLARVPFVSQDFLDIWHCVEPGRVKWQIRVSRMVVRMLDRYDIERIPTPTPSPSTSESPSPNPSDSASSSVAP
jgi:hypothetical protein